MSRRMVRPGVWIEEGPSGVASPPRWGGGLVVGGPATGPSPVLPPQRSADATARKREWNRSRPLRPVEREDSELGIVRRCRDCGEEWPMTPEFWYFSGGKLSGSYCKDCYNLTYKATRNAANRARRERLRGERPTCGAVMPQYAERCARTPGHKTEHRSAFAMDNARRKGLVA